MPDIDAILRAEHEQELAGNVDLGVKVEKLTEDEQAFVDAVAGELNFRGDWKKTSGELEQRRERMIVCEFGEGGNIRQLFQRWEALIKAGTQGVENPALFAIAYLPKKQYDTAKKEERHDLERLAVEEAKKELKRTALLFYRGRLHAEAEETHEEQPKEEVLQ